MRNLLPVFFFLTLPVIVSAGPSPDLGSTISTLLPGKGNGTITNEISCYALPYGGLGFVGHILNYWSILFLIFDREPLRPWKDLKLKWYNLTIHVIALLITVPYASYSIYACRNRWQFILLSVWKLTMSIALTCLSIHRSTFVNKPETMDSSGVTGKLGSSASYLQIPNNEDQINLTTYSNYSGSNAHLSPTFSSYNPSSTTVGGNVEQTTETDDNGNPTLDPFKKVKFRLFFWLAVYGLGTVVGMVGLFSIVAETWMIHAVRCVTEIFIAIVATPAVAYLIGVLSWGFLYRKVPSISINASLIFIMLLFGTGAFAAFYCDWIIASITDNYVGIPDMTNMWIFVVYYIAKRLPLFSL